MDLAHNLIHHGELCRGEFVVLKDVGGELTTQMLDVAKGVLAAREDGSTVWFDSASEAVHCFFCLLCRIFLDCLGASNFDF